MANKTTFKTVTFAGSPEFRVGNYKPRQRLERLVAEGMNHFSSKDYFPEVIVGDKLNGHTYRVDGVIPSEKHLISVRSQLVSGSTDDKLLTEIQSLQDACDMYGWEKATVIIDDPNNRMRWGQAYLTKNKFSKCYQRNRLRYPNVEVVEFNDFAARYFDHNAKALAS